ncbi:DNA-directed RNA polymerase subunit delta [Fructobacillus sp. M2-14]|uniref:Probable DNA-directed RNA polymerase subunit delta n=1 Tax=Fructobacillus broussonetiae TaxID=2713173 RepID=A0ABS5R2I8_9LACO|nr:DNA-directed RNA polymerase subunit delta [Fructobacillus broussonetiae]MBS9338774.1 DNA-directed RNA polymerase subunit delta [Fructobacillus broussonetiae]
MSQMKNGQLKEEMALVEIATAILSEQKKAMAFSDLVAAIEDFLGVDDETFKSRLSQFYTDLNTDGSFISLGNNEWALRAWYPVDAIDESIHEIDDEEEKPKKKKKASKKVNVFADNAADDDVIDYNDDDPEDDDFDDIDGHDAEDGDGNDSEDDDDSDKEESIDQNLTELAGTDDLDDLSDGDEEK